MSFGFLSEKLNKASMYIPLHIAEASSKFKDREKFYRVARTAAIQCCAILDTAIAMDLLAVEEWEKSKKLLRRIMELLESTA